MNEPQYPFLQQIGRIVNSGQSRSLILSGNIHDLFGLESTKGGDYVPLIGYLSRQWNIPDHILVVYELNGPIRFLEDAQRDKVRDAWLRWRSGKDADAIAIDVMLRAGKAQTELDAMKKRFDQNLQDAVGNPTTALELLRQLCLCSRSTVGGSRLLPENLVILVEGADMLLPEGPINNLSDADRHRISICQDWFGDPGFMNSADTVVMLAESVSLINGRIAHLPQIIEVLIPSPDAAARTHFIEWFKQHLPEGQKLEHWGDTIDDLVRFTAGLSIHALNQLLKAAIHDGRPITLRDVIAKVEDYIQSQLGEDIVEFKKPEQSLEQVIGFTKLKDFLRRELIPRFRSSGPDALPGAAVGGPIGGGKTFIFEAMATELDIVVLVLKNIRSKWFGETDVIFERLRRVLDALSKVLIFVDEADTQFGGVGPDAHETERRLTGKVQAMISDPRLRGRVIWLLMTARIHLLSADLRRPGRVGDLIIPVLDPEGEDLDAFLRWVVKPVLAAAPTDEQLGRLRQAMDDTSSASLASLRSELQARSLALGRPMTFEEVLEVVHDHLAPAIRDTRRYQTLQALVNCTRRSLLPDPKISDQARQAWQEEIRALELRGIH
jgi:hypothetical protein